MKISMQTSEKVKKTLSFSEIEMRPGLYAPIKNGVVHTSDRLVVTCEQLILYVHITSDYLGLASRTLWSQSQFVPVQEKISFDFQ